MKKWIKAILCVIVFVVCMALVVTGQKNIGVPGLCSMVVGLLGLLVLLYMYNRKYQ